MSRPHLNQLGLLRCDDLIEKAAQQRVAVSRNPSGTRIVDCGVDVAGGLTAGCAMAEICLAGLGEVTLTGTAGALCGAVVAVRTDQPLAACMAAQYAGWQVSVGNYFAMGSGPMRAARGGESLLDQLGLREETDSAVGILESAQLPDNATCQHIADQCGIDPARLTLLVAPTASLAGTVQVVARTVETALHKLHELNFEITNVVSGIGLAPLPPVASNDLAAIGRTNDAVLYGGQVTLWVRCQDDQLAAIGPQVPSCASPDYGRPFAEIFERYDRDFYRIDPRLFSPARIRFNNLISGRVFEYGELNEQVLRDSFFGPAAAGPSPQG